MSGRENIIFMSIRRDEILSLRRTLFTFHLLGHLATCQKPKKYTSKKKYFNRKRVILKESCYLKGIQN